MTQEEKAELFDWLTTLDSFSFKTWHYMGGKQTVEIRFGGDDEPAFTKGDTLLEALKTAKQELEYEGTR